MKFSPDFWRKVAVAGIFVGLLGCASLSQQPADAQANLLNKPTFERESWDVKFFGNPGKVTKDSTELHDGHPSLRIDQVTPGVAFINQKVTVKPATHYQFSGWIKATKMVLPKEHEAEKSGAALAISGGLGNSGWVSDTGTWVHASVDFTTSGTQTEVQLGPRIGFNQLRPTGTAWFAQISLVELGQAPGVAVRPNPVPPAPAPPAPATPNPSKHAASDTFIFGELVKANHDNLIVVTGSNGSGSGFIAGLNGANFVFTNVHVAAGVKDAAFKKLDGTKIAAGSPFAAVDHDVFRLATPPGGKPFEIMDHVESNAAIGDAVVVLGNAEGAGVINTIKGTIVGIGPNLVEVDAPIVPGNSGSPIIHVASGKVIGVATYALVKRYDPETLRKPGASIIRRFGYRLDSVKTWQPVNWSTFAAQAAEMESIEQLTADLGKLLSDVAAKQKITPGLHTNPAIKAPIDLWTTDQSRQLSPGDKAMAQQNFISRIKSACQSDLAAARPRLTYDYFQRKLNEEQRHRDDIANAVTQMFQIIPGH